MEVCHLAAVRDQWTVPMPALFRKLRAPVSVQFELTYRCNNRCIFCHNPGHPDSDISPDLARHVLKTLADAKVFRCIFTGGEPILHPHCLELFGYARELGLTTALITNGVATLPFVSTLLELGCTSFEVSVLGSEAKMHDSLVRHPGAFDRAMGVLEALGKSHPSVTVNVNATITSHNYQDIGRIYRRVRAAGARSFTVTRFVPTNPNDDITPSPRMLNVALRDLLKARSEIGMPFRFLTPIPFCAIEPDISLAELSTAMSRCDGAVSWCTITPMATIKPCPCWHIPCGDLKHSSCSEAWQTDATRSRIVAQGFIPEACKACSLLQTCGAGCRACAPEPDGMDYAAARPIS